MDIPHAGFIDKTSRFIGDLIPRRPPWALLDDVRVAAAELHDGLRRLDERLGEGLRYDGDCLAMGFPGLCRALGTTGLPRGRLIEIAGPAGSGRCSLALAMARAAQAAGATVVVADPDMSYPSQRLAEAGLNPETTLVVREKNPSKMLAALKTLLESRSVDLVLAAPDLLHRESFRGLGADGFGVGFEESRIFNELTDFLRCARLEKAAVLAPATRPPGSVRSCIGGGLRIGLERKGERAVEARIERGIAGSGGLVRLRLLPDGTCNESPRK